MCGIVGVAGRARPADIPLVCRMRDTLTHRGPDDSGLWSSSDGRVALAQRRLAIIDLSPGGHQPMTDAATGVTVTYNGEIYNFLELRAELEGRGHKFRTRSDTEVLLAAYREWGTACLSRLNGMFAFGLFDPGTRTVILARDRAGEKPLFYREAAGTLAFASELKALLADPAAPRRLDLDSFAFLLALGYVPWDRCILSGFRKLPQGHALQFDVETGALRVWPFWSLPDPAPGPADRPEELEEELERLLLDSVRLRLIADVPVGILLSGGIDSSLITAMATRVSPQRVKTFTISFPGHGAFDEAPHARLVAEKFGTDHAELAAEPATTDLLPTLARQYDEPIGDASMLPTYLVSRLIRQHATVALGGDGGDELFAGYHHYDWLRRHARMRRRMPEPVRSAIGAGAARLLPLGTRGRSYLIAGSRDVKWAIAHTAVQFDPASRRRLLKPLRGRPARNVADSPEAWRSALTRPTDSPLQQATRADFRSYLVDDILVKVDRASMLTSLEVRAPWLDPRIIEFAYGKVPDELRYEKGEKKILPRRLGKRLLPKELDLSRKRGFSIPLASWFRSGFGLFVEDVMRAADPALFDQPAIQSLIRCQRRGLVNEDRLFLLTMFELWRREYAVTI